ncbi:MAG: Holliday junction resolvase RuvX [Bacteroidetes bacterium]|nr:Holliday junction resolvase RuvX [Bacteroidota bacterium]
MGRILAIDYGQKRVGIAVTDEMQIIASPLTTMPAGEIILFLKDYIGKNSVETIVVGEPKQMNNTASESVKFIDPFVKRLRKEFADIKLERIDERFTSLIATQTIRNSGLKKKDRQNKSLVDAISATIILQSFLEAKQLKH